MFDAVANQIRDHNDKDRTWKNCLFFLGDQDANDSATYLVDDHRLACFVRLHRTDYRNL